VLGAYNIQYRRLFNFFKRQCFEQDSFLLHGGSQEYSKLSVQRLLFPLFSRVAQEKNRRRQIFSLTTLDDKKKETRAVRFFRVYYYRNWSPEES
jgi:hypothetical protein